MQESCIRQPGITSCAWTAARASAKGAKAAKTGRGCFFQVLSTSPESVLFFNTLPTSRRRIALLVRCLSHTFVCALLLKRLHRYQQKRNGPSGHCAWVALPERQPISLDCDPRGSRRHETFPGGWHDFFHVKLSILVDKQSRPRRGSLQRRAAPWRESPAGPLQIYREIFSPCFRFVQAPWTSKHSGSQSGVSGPNKQLPSLRSVPTAQHENRQLHHDSVADTSSFPAARH